MENLRKVKILPIFIVFNFSDDVLPIIGGKVRFVLRVLDVWVSIFSWTKAHVFLFTLYSVYKKSSLHSAGCWYCYCCVCFIVTDFCNPIANAIWCTVFRVFWLGYKNDFVCRLLMRSALFHHLERRGIQVG